QPTFADTKKTESNTPAVPLDCARQLLPPSSLCRIAPLSPTAQPICSSTKNTDRKSEAVPPSCISQRPPPSSVCRIVPRSPTAQPTFAEKNRIDARLGREAAPAPCGRSHQFKLP